jgi:hypothetical protein
MKEDVVAANLANLRQSINELKECINRQNVTPNQTEQHIKMDLDEKTIYNGVAKSFCTCWNDALSVVKKHVWKQQPDTLPFSLWFPKIVDIFKQKSRLLEYIYTHICDYNLNRLNIEINTENILRRQDEILSKINELKRKYSVNHVFSSRTSIINFTSKKQSYDDTRRSGRDNELLPRAQCDL